MAAYSQDLRDRVLRALDRGDGPTDIARRLEVSRAWVYYVQGRRQQTGQRSSLRVGGYRRSRLTEVEPQIRAWIEAEPCLTLAEMCERLAGQGIAAKTGALCHHLNRWNLTFKKNSARQRARSRRRTGGQTHVA
jgi:transposase